MISKCKLSFLGMVYTKCTLLLMNTVFDWYMYTCMYMSDHLFTCIFLECKRYTHVFLSSPLNNGHFHDIPVELCISIGSHSGATSRPVDTIIALNRCYMYIDWFISNPNGLGILLYTHEFSNKLITDYSLEIHRSQRNGESVVG